MYKYCNNFLRRKDWTLIGLLNLWITFSTFAMRYHCVLWRWTVMSLTFRGWVINKLSKKETTIEISQLIERSFPYVSPYIMVKYPDTPLVAITSIQPTNTNHHGSPPWQHFFLAESPLMLSSGLGLPSSWSPSRLDEGSRYSRRPFIPWTCCMALL